MPPLPPGKRHCINAGVGARKGPNAVLNQEDATVDYVCKLLGIVLDRPIVDRTGLQGKYRFHLEFAIDQSSPGVGPAGFGPPSDDPPAPSIFHVERPSGN
jgi:uncharacterized protein (TIGR03435 family)